MKFWQRLVKSSDRFWRSRSCRDGLSNLQGITHCEDEYLCICWFLWFEYNCMNIFLESRFSCLGLGPVSTATRQFLPIRRGESLGIIISDTGPRRLSIRSLIYWNRKRNVAQTTPHLLCKRSHSLQYSADTQSWNFTSTTFYSLESLNVESIPCLKEWPGRDGLRLRYQAKKKRYYAQLQSWCRIWRASLEKWMSRWVLSWFGASIGMASAVGKIREGRKIQSQSRIPCFKDDHEKVLYLQYIIP